MKYRERKLKAQGLHFTEPTNLETFDETKLPNPLVSLIPLISVPITLNVFKMELVASLLIAVILTAILNYKSFHLFSKCLNDGAAGGLVSIGNTAAANGFGAVVKAVPGFATLTQFVFGIKGSPLISEAIATSLLAGATGSGSGGITIGAGSPWSKIYGTGSERSEPQPGGSSPSCFHRLRRFGHLAS